MRLTILSRSSALAQLQAQTVADAITSRFPDVVVNRITRASAGDRDTLTQLSRFTDKGAFTSDLSTAVAEGAADLVVHSWKDLPVEGHPGTVIAATLERADPRDLLLMRRTSCETRPHHVMVLTSSPRRAWMLQTSLAPLLPWPVERIETRDVRGNIMTRVQRLIDGDADALVVAKAALDRLLQPHNGIVAPDPALRTMLARCRWMVLPLRRFPAAPAQGALAIEVAARHTALRDRLAELCHAPTWDAVNRERALLEARGGGCHDAFGATVLPRPYGRVLSARGLTGGTEESTWSLAPVSPAPPRADAAAIWPRQGEARHFVRRALPVPLPVSADGFWVARTEALPHNWTLSDETPVWAAGDTTWQRLAARGVWVSGCADGLGDEESPALDTLAGRIVSWVRLTHAGGRTGPDALATYEVAGELPRDLASRTHFFWTSGSEFTRALTRWPALAGGWHGSGPGSTSRVIRAALGDSGRAGVWLDYDQWLHEVTT